MGTWRANKCAMSVSRHFPGFARSIPPLLLSSRVALAIATALAIADPNVFADQAFLRAAADSNVNQRYIVESVSVGGVQVESAKLPSTLRRRLTALVGSRCDMAAIEDLAAEMRKELHL